MNRKKIVKCNYEGESSKGRSFGEGESSKGRSCDEGESSKGRSFGERNPHGKRRIHEAGNPKVDEDPHEDYPREQTIPLWKVNLLALFLIPPVTAILAVPFVLLWGVEPLDIRSFIRLEYLLLVVVPGVVLHELLHGAGWAAFANGGFKAIKFGFKWQFLTPYCHCKEPLEVPFYAFGAGLPLLVLGIIPVIIAYITGSGAWMIFGLFFTWAAGGDMIALFTLMKLDKHILVSDHPEEMGFYIQKSVK